MKKSRVQRSGEERTQTASSPRQPNKTPLQPLDTVLPIVWSTAVSVLMEYAGKEEKTLLKLVHIVGEGDWRTVAAELTQNMLAFYERVQGPNEALGRSSDQCWYR